jgi:uncharacterized membrane protein YdbT with pleckstrin-like domain
MGRTAVPVHPPAGGTPGDPGPERPLWEGRPSLKALLGAIIGAGMFTLLLTLSVFLAYRPLVGSFARSSRSAARFVDRYDEGLWLAVLAFAVTLVVVRLAGLAWRIAVLKTHHYRITNQRIVIESGVFSKRIDEIDMRTIGDLEFRQTLIERLLSIGGITVLSSDKSTSRYQLIGLERPRELRELIRTSAYQATRGQLFTRET